MYYYGNRMQKYFIISLIIFSAFFPGLLRAQASAEKINWLTFQQAVELAKKNPRKILIDVYTDWCGWCKKMDAETFTHPVIVRYINENFYAVKFNAEQHEDVVFQNHTFRFVNNGGRGYHELAAALLNNQLSYPSMAYLDENLQLLGAIPGFRQAKDLEPILKYIREDVYKKMAYDKFLQTFQGQVR